ncbi:universal stress protein [Porticoccus sp.]|uniref:universal stress protein n=1 Tax=Porticoccus sp. TaxID=2024853 RepID=UPI003F69D804
MNNNHQRSTILACIDGSTYRESVTDYASWVAQKLQAPLKLLHNIEHRETPLFMDLSGNIGLGGREELLEELTSMEERRSKILLEQGKLMLQEAYRRAMATGSTAPEILQRHGGLEETLAEMEEEIRVLVVGVRGEEHQHQEKQLGAHLESLIRAMHRPVLVVNRPFEQPPQRIMIAYNGNEASRKALDMMSLSPLYRGLVCHIVHVSDSADIPSAQLEEAAATLQNAGLEVVSTSLQGNVQPQLEQYCRENRIELIVMGAFGQSRLRELLFGSLTQRMLINSNIPLLLLR